MLDFSPLHGLQGQTGWLKKECRKDRHTQGKKIWDMVDWVFCVSLIHKVEQGVRTYSLPLGQGGRFSCIQSKWVKEQSSHPRYPQENTVFAWTPKEGFAISLSLSRELSFSYGLEAFGSLAWAAHVNNTHLSWTFSTPCTGHLEVLNYENWWIYTWILLLVYNIHL